MKQKAKTIKNKSTQKMRVFLVAFMLLVGVSLALFQGSAGADNYDDQISSIQREIEGYRSESAKLAHEADSLQKVINELGTQKSIIQAQIDLSQAKYDKLKADIEANKKKLGERQDFLSSTISDMTADSQISPIEVLASSTTVGDYIEKQQYHLAVQDQLQKSIDEVTKIKKELEKQKIDVERVLSDQQSQRNALAAKEAEQARLLVDNQDQQATYEGIISSRSGAISSLREQQRASYAAYGTSSSSPTGLDISYKNLQTQSCSNSGYNYCNYGWDDIVGDPWGLGYTKECVHYAADTLARRGYYIPYGLFAGRGNANQWIGTTTSSSTARLVSDPQRDDVVYMPIGGVGHVGIVEENYGNGYIKVSQMNLPFGGYYSTMDLKVTSNLSFLRFSR